jgi:hypothetical protein
MVIFDARIRPESVSSCVDHHQSCLRAPARMTIGVRSRNAGSSTMVSVSSRRRGDIVSSQIVKRRYEFEWENTGIAPTLWAF